MFFIPSTQTYLVVVILRGAAGVKAKVEAAGTWYVDHLLELVVVSHRVDRLHRLARGPGGRNLQASQEAFFFIFTDLHPATITTVTQP